MLKYFELTQSDNLKLIKQINFMLPYYAEALVLNGLFDSNDLNNFKEFINKLNVIYSTSDSLRHPQQMSTLTSVDSSLPCTSSSLVTEATDSTSISIENKLNNFKYKIEYLNETLDNLTQVILNNKPMKLKNMCRIIIKDHIQEFDFEIISKSNLNDHARSFLLFNEEFEQMYEKFHTI